MDVGHLESKVTFFCRVSFSKLFQFLATIRATDGKSGTPPGLQLMCKSLFIFMLFTIKQ